MKETRLLKMPVLAYPDVPIILSYCHIHGGIVDDTNTDSNTNATFNANTNTIANAANNTNANAHAYMNSDANADTNTDAYTSVNSNRNTSSNTNTCTTADADTQSTTNTSSNTITNTNFNTFNAGTTTNKRNQIISNAIPVVAYLVVPKILSYCHMHRGIVSLITSGSSSSDSTCFLNSKRKKTTPAARDVCTLVGTQPL